MPYLFSYGSNNITQLSQRIKRNILKSEIIPAYIEDYTRIFCFYSSTWNGSVASIMYRRTCSYSSVQPSNMH